MNARDYPKSSPPLAPYARITQHLKDELSRGRWPPGAAMPSDAELVAQFGVSRMTVTRALNELRAEGLIERVQGVGTFAAHLARGLAPAYLLSGDEPLLVGEAADAIRAIQITSRFPAVHGAPVHLGDPAQIGIADLARPDYGDAVELQAGELPLFWACGVTPQAALERARPEICITHAPGAMLVTDLLNTQLAAF